MGQSQTKPSTPPPLIEVSAPGGRILVPPYTPFTLCPPPAPLPSRRRQRIPRVPRPDYIIEQEGASEDLDVVGGGMIPFSPPRGGGGGGGGGRGRMAGIGGIRGGGGGRPPFIYDVEGRPHAHPMASPAMGSFGGMGMGMGMGMPPGIMRPGGMNMPADLPPGYSSFPTSPQGVGGGENPHFRGGGGGVPDYPPSSASTSTQGSRPVQRRSSGRHEHIPMGAFAGPKTAKPTRHPQKKQSTSSRLNRVQNPARAVGPSGKEWIPGDPFLDACTCTVNCTCREGHRVLYHSKDEVVEDSDGSGGARYAQGEIRYILKKDLGRDCGDHSACVTKKDEGSETSSEASKKRDKIRRAELKNMKEELLEAFDERFDEIKKARSSKAGSVSSPRPPFPGLHAAAGGGGGMNPLGMGGAGGMGIDPMMAQKMAGLGLGGNMDIGSNPYALGPQGMGEAVGPMGRQQMRSAPARMERGMPFDDEMPMGGMDGRMNNIGMGLGNPYLAAAGMKPSAMRKRSGGPVGFEDLDMGEMPLYGGGPRMGRGLGMMRGQHSRQRGYGSEPSDIRYKHEKGKGNRKQPDVRGRRRATSSDDDENDSISSPNKLRKSSPRGRSNLGSNDRNRRGRPARAETEDDDVY